MLFLLAPVLFLTNAQAASYKQTFTIPTPAITCHNEHASRAIGRSINVVGDPVVILKAAKSSGAPMSSTRVNDLSAFDQFKSCDDVTDLPKTLKGQRELWVQRLESQGECNAIIIEEIMVKLGRSGAFLHGKTAWPVVGTDLSAYTKEICKLTEIDFKNAIKQALAK